jgi:hypothetical protein
MSGWSRVRVCGSAPVAVSAIAAIVLLQGGLASASTQAPPKALVGCWHRHAPALPVGTAAGVWLMRIKGGQLSAFTPGMTSCSVSPDFTGTLSVTGGRVTIGPLPVCPTKGIYSWKIGKKSLTLKAISDTCAARKLLFTGVWKS